MKLIRLLLLSCSLFVSFSANAWDGYDYESGNYIDIGKNNTVRSGRNIEYYEYGKGEYREGEVQHINGRGRKTEVMIQDSESGELRTFEME